MLNISTKLSAVSAALLMLLSPLSAKAAATVMNPGEAKGQLIILSEQDVEKESPKYKALTPYSIPVFPQLPAELAVVAGAITLSQQNLLSHVQLKSRARGTPNLDISGLEGGMSNPLLKDFKDGDWIHMVLKADGTIELAQSTEDAAIEFQKNRKPQPPVTLKSDYTDTRILTTEQTGWQDFVKVGSKAANYGELSKIMNTPGQHPVVRPGFAITIHYYREFLEQNPDIKEAIRKMLADPLMKRIAKVEYREAKLKAIRDMIMSKKSKLNDQLVDSLIDQMDQHKTRKGQPKKFKLRSSTNAEDLPNFNGAGLYSSMSYKPVAKKVELSRDEKRELVKEAMRLVYGSVWNFRAYEERTFFGIPHGEVAMGMQVKPSFSDEEVDGVLVTKNIAKDPRYTGPAVYFEAQRGDKYGVANPQHGEKPEKILVLYDEKNPLDMNAYQIKVLQKSNVADDKKTILPHDNPNPIMTDKEIKETILLALKAHIAMKPTVGDDDPNFSLDLEFKVDMEDTGTRKIYYEQARPYIE